MKGIYDFFTRENESQSAAEVVRLRHEMVELRRKTFAEAAAIAESHWEEPGWFIARAIRAASQLDEPE